MIPSLVTALITCRKYLTSRALWAHRHWLRDSGLLYYIVTSDPKLNKEFVVDGNSLTLRSGDDYEHLVDKMISLYSVLSLLHPDHDVLKVDDDVFLNTKRLPSTVAGIRRSGAPMAGHLIGTGAVSGRYHFNKVSDKSFKVAYETPNLGPYPAGSCYFIRRDMVPLVAKAKELYPTETAAHMYEDKCVSDTLRLSGHEHRLQLQSLVGNRFGRQRKINETLCYWELRRESQYIDLKSTLDQTDSAM